MVSLFFFSPQVVQAPAEMRYNLRRHKNSAKEVANNGALSDLSKGKEEAGDDGIATKATGAVSTDIASENGGSTNFVEQYEGDAFYGNADTSSKQLEDDMVLSEEISGTPVRQSEAHSDEVTGGDDEDDDEDDDEEETEHPGEASMGKKFWNFLTT